LEERQLDMLEVGGSKPSPPTKPHTFKEAAMETVKSKDGTSIGYDRVGEGPVVLFVDGALSTRRAKADLARLLAERFTVYSYDRRGRGDSGDTQPYAVDREIEDIDALIDAGGGSAFLYGHSSGGCLALDATVELRGKVGKLAMYEAPYNDDPAAQKAWGDYLTSLTDLLASGRRGDAVALFMALVGTPAAQIEGMRHAPFWAGMEAIAPTLAYDHIGIMGRLGSIPTERAARIQVPTLVISGTSGLPFMLETAKTLSRTIPGAELRTLDGQGHDVHAEVLAPVLAEFFAAGADE
jgi:pimeloyl-ACP methyl ester carboxylesterase